MASAREIKLLFSRYPKSHGQNSIHKITSKSVLHHGSKTVLALVVVMILSVGGVVLNWIV
jgi:hypothetical protein